MKESTIRIDVQLDEQKVPDNILWSASDSSAEERQQARAMMLSFWDPADKAALRIDLWTKDMMVDEMVDFFYQSMMGMADTLERSTGQQALVHDFRHFAKDFFKKFQESQRQGA
ncbi:MAG: gliding motility protein GldC [Chitinophagaceae bacterium]|jgi:gliding motility-associated protein GldC|nr:gliding motility protein GldC [Chitinophagaceae bacterium]